MAPSPSDPYKSRFVRTVLTQTRRWLDRSQTTVRRLKVAASWGTQVVLYPLYALFQGTRWLGQRVEQTIQLGDAAEAVPPAEAPAIARTVAASRSLTVDSPLQQVLQAVQPFLPGEMTVALSEVEIVVRAIASSVTTQALVLVDAENQELDVLTPAQQQQLAQLIQVQLVQCQRRQQFWERPKRFLDAVVQRVRSRLPAPLQMAPAPALPALPSPFTAEAPIYASLDWVQQILPSLPFMEVLQLPAARSTVGNALVPSVATSLAAPNSATAIATTVIRGVASLLDTRSLVLTTAQNTILDILTPDQQHQIQRRMSWEVAHYHRYLRLRQQSQRLTPLRPPSAASPLLPPVRAFRWLMAWMQSGPIAAATNLFQEASLVACPLPPTALPPQLPRAAAPPQKFDSRLLDQLSLAWSDVRHHLGQQLQQRAWARWFLALPPGSIAKSTAPIAPPPSADSTAIAPSGPAAITQQAPVGQLRSHPASVNSSKDLGRSPVYSPTALGSLETTSLDAVGLDEGLPSDICPDDYPDNIYIDADVTLMGYEQSWFERVMRWLDQCFVWIETKLSQIWQWLTNQQST